MTTRLASLAHSLTGDARHTFNNWKESRARLVAAYQFARESKWTPESYDVLANAARKESACFQLVADHLSCPDDLKRYLLEVV